MGRKFQINKDCNLINGLNFKGQILEYIKDYIYVVEDIEPDESNFKSIILRQPEFDANGKKCAKNGTLVISFKDCEEVFDDE